MKDFLQQHHLFIGLIILLILITFNQVFNHGFVWDDIAFIQNQNHAQLPALSSLVDGTFPVPQTGAYRPARNVVYAITLPLFKGNATLHHTFVLALHLIITLQVFYLASHLIPHLNGAKLVTLLFALHPLHTESINWITAGYDLLFVIWYLATLIAHIKKPGSNQVLVFTLLALFTNEIALTLPALIMSYDYLVKRKPLTPSLRIYMTYWLLALIYWIFRSGFIVQNPFSTRVYNSLPGEATLGIFLLGHYLYQLFAPVHLTPDHLFQPGLTGLYSQNHRLGSPPPSLDFSLLGISLPFVLALTWLFILGILILKRRRLGWYMLWVVITLLPVLRVVPLPATYSERYAYLASVGFLLLVGHVAYQAINRQTSLARLTPPFFVTIAIFFGLLTMARTPIWRSNTSLWQDALAKNPESASATSALGVQAYLDGDIQTSYEYHRRAAQMNPYISSFQQNYVSILVELEKYQEIIDFVELILKTDATNVNLYTILASTYDAKGDYDRAMANYQRAYDLTKLTDPRRREIEKLVEELDQKYGKPTTNSN